MVRHVYLFSRAVHRSRLMAILAMLATVLFFPSPPALQAHEFDTAYYNLEQYLQLHPEQKELMDSFQERVQAPGIRLSVPQEEAVRIALVYPGGQVSDYWRRSISAFTRRLNECGLRYEIFEYFADSLENLQMEEEYLRSALALDADYLVFTVDQTRHVRLVERILARERPKVILQNVTTPIQRREGRQPFLYVGFDHATGARMLADEYLDRVGYDPEYAVLYMSEGLVSTMRGDTFVSYINKETGRIPLMEFYTDNRRDLAENATREILSKFTPDFIYACSTDTALAAAQVIQESGLSGQVLVNGWGGGGPELEALARGLLDLTVMRMNDDNGVAMAEAVILDVLGQDRNVPLVYSGSFAIIDRNTDPDTLQEMKARAFRYSEN